MLINKSRSNSYSKSKEYKYDQKKIMKALVVKDIKRYFSSTVYIFNTAFIYEIGVLKVYAEPLLYAIDSNSKYYEEARRLIRFLKIFLPIPADDVPQDSLLREFIGKSCFYE